MKRLFTTPLSLVAITMMTITLFACKDDDDPVVPVVTFQSAARTVGEGAGTIDVAINLDVAAPREIVVRYSLSGTANEGTTTSADYQVLGTFERVTIPQGSSSGTIQLQIKQDDLVEADETIIITLSGVDNNAATIGSANTATITIENDDLGSAVSFASATRTIKESDGIIEVQLVLDRAATQALTVDYAFNYTTLSGKAIDSLQSYTDERIPPGFYDFRVQNPDYGKVTIPAGSTTGIIRLKFFSDFYFENDETVEITLTGITGGGQLGATTKHTITVEQEDGRAIVLLWNPDYTDVDMDLFLWVGEDASSFDEEPLAASLNPDPTPQEEIVFIPTTLSSRITDLTFGLSYVYYSGTEDPMEFEVVFADFANGAFEAAAGLERFAASYTLANINPWSALTDVQIEQTFKIVDGEYVDISTPITVPASGSRLRKYTVPAPAGLTKEKVRFPLRSFRR